MNTTEVIYRHSGLNTAEPQIAVGALISLEALEAEHIRRILESTRTLGEAAAILKIDPATLYRKRAILGLPKRRKGGGTS